MAVQEYPAPESISRLQTRAFGVGAIALLLAIYGAVHSPQTFFASYLMSFLLFLGLALGSLGLVMLQHLTSGHWGIIIRRPLESATRTLPLLVVLFLPIAISGMKHLYRAWLDRSEEHTSELQSRFDLVCRLLLEKKKKKNYYCLGLSHSFFTFIFTKAK